MSQEQIFDLISWWNEQTFPGKELYKLDENGELTIRANSNIKERVIATIAPENAAVVLKTLLEKFAQVESRVRDTEVEWLAAEDKLRLADKVGHLKEYLDTVGALGDMHRLALLVHDWQHTIYQLSEENHAVKLKLVEAAESLTESDAWKETTQAFRDIADKWKETGFLDKNRNDKLWNRIEAARKAFYDRKRRHQEEEEKDMLQNLDLKIDLVEQAESIASSEEWKKTTETFHRLTEEWKTIGHTLNKKNEELWQRFIAAKGSFFDRKKLHYNQVQQEQEGNYEVKTALVEKAEALKDSRDWNVTAQAYASLMEEWKKTGRVPQEKSEELWKRFTDAQEQFFSAKKAHFDGVKSVQEENYNLKKELYDRAERIKNSTRWSDTTNELNELLDEWKKIGPIPRSYGDKLWEDFIAARKHFFARKDASREERKQYMESQKEVRAEQAKGMVKKMEQDIRDEEEKLVDFRNAIGNITPGKKAEELRTHLQQLIEESTKNIVRLKEKFAKAEQDIKAVAEPVVESNESTGTNSDQ